jgi:hypothetical protein
MCVCLFVLLCTRTVDTLEPNQLHIRNQYDQEVQHWSFIFQKNKKKFLILAKDNNRGGRDRNHNSMVAGPQRKHCATVPVLKFRDLI